MLHHRDNVDHSKSQQDHLDPTIHPHPERSFANVAGNKNFPSSAPNSTNNGVDTSIKEKDGDGNPSTWTQNFPLPQEAAAAFNSEAKNRGVDLCTAGVGDLLNKKASPSLKSGKYLSGKQLIGIWFSYKIADDSRYPFTYFE